MMRLANSKGTAQRWTLWCAALWLVAAGCKATAPAEPQRPDVDIAALIEKYNQRVAKIEHLWARAVVEMHWVDAEGKRHYEQGDGLLLIRRPSELALTIGKVGNTWYWLGGNAEHYWWLDMFPNDDLPDTAYIADYESGDAAAREMGMPVAPRSLIDLLGMTPIPSTAKRISVEADDSDAKSLIWLESSLAESHEPVVQRIGMDPDTAWPLEILFLDGEGKVLAHARLSEFRPLAVPNRPPGYFPQVATRIAVEAPAQDARITLHMGSETMTSDPEKFSDVHFNFQQLIKAHKIPPDRVKLYQP